MGLIEDYLLAGYNWMISNFINVVLSLYQFVFNIVYYLFSGIFNFIFDTLSYLLDIVLLITRVIIESFFYFLNIFIQAGSILLKLLPDVITLIFFSITHIYLILILAETIILGIVIATPGFMNKLGVFWRLNFGMGNAEDDLTYSILSFFLRLPKYINIIYTDLLLLINTVVRLLDYILNVIKFFKDIVFKIFEWVINIVKVII